jgi:hypothetical protein
MRPAHRKVVAVEAIALAAAVAILAAGRAETDVDTSYAEAFFPVAV